MTDLKNETFSNSFWKTLCAIFWRKAKLNALVTVHLKLTAPKTFSLSFSELYSNCSLDHLLVPVNVCNSRHFMLLVAFNIYTASKVPKYGVFSGPNAEKYRTEKTPYLDTFYALLKKIFNLLLPLKLMNHSAWTVSVFGVIPVRILLHSDWILRDSSYPSVFSVNAGKYGPDQLRIRTRFYAVSR